MKIYCDKCKENHEFNLLDIEYLIYGLQAMHNYEENSGNSADLKEQYSWPDIQLACLNELLGVARDLEGYAEHTDSMRDSRVAHELAEMSWHMDEAIHRAKAIIKEQEC